MPIKKTAINIIICFIIHTVFILYLCKILSVVSCIELLRWLKNVRSILNINKCSNIMSTLKPLPLSNVFHLRKLMATSMFICYCQWFFFFKIMLRLTLWREWENLWAFHPRKLILLLKLITKLGLKVQQTEFIQVNNTRMQHS